MKKTIFLAMAATMIVTALTGCVNKSTTINTRVATSDEAATTDSAGIMIDTDGNTIEIADGKFEIQTSDGQTVAVDSNGAKVTNEKKSTSVADNEGNQTAAQKQTSDSAKASDDKAASKNNNQQSKTATTNQTNKSADKNKTIQTQPKTNTPATTTDPHAGKTWHEAEYKTIKHPAETKMVKVIDQDAYSYEEPVYEMRRIAKCKDCGMDISQLGSNAERIAHANQHIDEGGDGGWYSTTEEVQVGTRTVHVPEQSHMEKIVVKDAWIEEVIVKKAGWY